MMCGIKTISLEKKKSLNCVIYYFQNNVWNWKSILWYCALWSLYFRYVLSLLSFS